MTETNKNPAAGITGDKQKDAGQEGTGNGSTDIKDNSGNKGKKKIAMLRVRSLDKAGFRRGGFKFDADGTEIVREDLSDEQYAAITSEPRLAVEQFTV